MPKKKTTSEIKEIKNVWGMIAYLISYRTKEIIMIILAVLVVLLILNIGFKVNKWNIEFEKPPLKLKELKK